MVSKPFASKVIVTSLAQILTYMSITKSSTVLLIPYPEGFTLELRMSLIKVMIIIVPTLFLAIFSLLCYPPYFDNIILSVLAERIRGNSTNDDLTGTPDNDRISGSGGNDTLVGLAGNDEIDGGRGMDIISGSDGDDYLIGGQH